MKYPKTGHAGKSWTKQQHSFATVEAGVSRERSSFDRPSRTISTIDANFLYPCLVDEVLPGDTYQLRAQIQAWLATPLKPFLDNLYVTVHYFFTPNRLVWENWQRFQGEKDDPGDVTTYTVPQISIEGGVAGIGLLADYMGIPVRVADFEVNAMPFRGYNLIWNDYYRDTALQDSLVVDIDDADSLESDYVLKKRGRRKDYLTSCLPYPQAPGDTGTPGIISGVVPVTTTDTTILFEDESTNESSMAAFSSPVSAMVQTGVPDTLDVTEPLRFGSVTGLEADLATAEANTINQLRQSIAIQQLLELDARAGTRYVEQLKARFGVTTADARLMRPEFLGGSTVNIAVQPVPGTNQASAPAAEASHGRLAGFGNARGPIGGFTHSFTEHGWILGLISLRSDYTYFQGVKRHWTRTTRYDYFEPALAHLGEQPVYNREIWITNDSEDDLVFGYQERFSEYKYGNSMATALMSPDAFGQIAQWHLAEDFLTRPLLNDAFIQDNTPVDRVIQVPAEPHVIFDMYFSNRTTRVMPVHNTPGLRRL